MRPVFSVIICTHNRKELVKRAIKSVLNQSYKNFEVIIVDDGSTDNTNEEISNFKDSRLRYYRNKSNKGVIYSKSKGLEQSNGDYICFLDSDDELMPNALNKAFSFIRKEDYSLFLFNCVDYESQRISGKFLRNYIGPVNFNDLLCEKISGDFFRVFKKSLTKDITFDKNLFSGEILFWLKIHLNNKALYVPEVLYLAHRVGRERLSNFDTQIKSKKNLINVNKLLLKRFGLVIKKECPKIYGRRLAILGFWQMIDNNYREARKNLKSSLKYKMSFVTIVLLLLTSFDSKNLIIWLYKKMNSVVNF